MLQTRPRFTIDDDELVLASYGDEVEEMLREGKSEGEGEGVGEGEGDEAVHMDVNDVEGGWWITRPPSPGPTSPHATP